MKFRLRFDAYDALITPIEDGGSQVVETIEVQIGGEFMGVAYETLRGLEWGIHELEVMRETDRKRRELMNAILDDPAARVMLFPGRDQVAVWSIGRLIPSVETLLKIVHPGESFGVVSFKTLRAIGRGETTIEELMSEECNPSFSDDELKADSGRKVPMYKGKPIPERFAGGFSVEVVAADEPPVDGKALIARRKRQLELEAQERQEKAAEMNNADILKQGTPLLVIGKGRVFIRRVWNPGGTGVRGSVSAEIKPGEYYNGWSYEELRSLGNGFHELPLKQRDEDGLNPAQASD